MVTGRTWIPREVPDLEDGLESALLGDREDHDCRPRQRKDAPEDAEHVEAVVGKDVREDNAAAVGKGPQGEGRRRGERRELGDGVKEG